MNIFNMRGNWGKLTAYLYENVVSSGIKTLYDILIEEAFKGLKREKILDVGSGPGYVPINIAKKFPEVEIIGVDQCPDMIKIATEKAKKEDIINLKFQLGDALNLPFESNQFDIVYSIASLKHWPDYEKGIEEIYRVLKPSGKFFLIEADRGASSIAIRNFIKFWNFMLSKKIGELYFRVFVSGQSIDIWEAKEIMEKSSFQNFTLRRIKDYPFFTIEGFK